MSKTYYCRFGSGDPRPYTGLSPTFLIFNNAGTAVTPPAIAEVTGATGIYSFAYGVTTPICFLIDAATTSPGSAGRYITGAIDPNDRGDEYGNTLIAIGNTLGTNLTNVGSTLVAIGNTSSIQSVGATLQALGSSILAGQANIGSTLVAIGNTSSIFAVGSTLQAIGSTLLQGQVNFGSTLVAIGNTASISAVGSTLSAIGSTLLQGQVNFGSTLVAIGNTVAAINTNLSVGSSIYAAIGTTASPIGDSATNPSTLFGYMKRVQEDLEGNQSFTKSTGAFSILDRTGATTLAAKTITNNASLVTRS